MSAAKAIGSSCHPVDFAEDVPAGSLLRREVAVASFQLPVAGLATPEHT